MKDIKEIKQMLIAAQKLCGRGILDVSTVNKQAVKPLLAVKTEIAEYLGQNPNDIEALRSACYVECYLMNYKAGLSYLERASALSGDRKDKQNLIGLSEVAASLTMISLSPDDFSHLGQYLDEALKENFCEHNLKNTKAWLNKNIEKKKHGKIIKGLQNSGGFCDCEVLANVLV